MEIKVKDCNNCPFRSMGGWEGEYSVCTIFPTEKKIPQDKPLFGNIKKSPEWCPLKETDITITLRE